MITYVFDVEMHGLRNANVMFRVMVMFRAMERYSKLKDVEIITLI